MYIATLGPYWVKRFGGPIICEPVVYAEYPFVQNYPDSVTDFDGGISYFYDLPVLGGTTFNLNLSGFAPAWIATDGSVLTSLMGDTTTSPLRVDGPVAAGVDGNINQWSYVRSFWITQPASFAAYAAVGGNDTGTVNAPPGWNEYPGVASYDAWYRSLVKARNYGLPIVYEMWYSLNINRVDKTKGYDNYSWAGDGGATSFPYIDVSAHGGHVRKYYAGIFKVTANMYAPADADIIAGVTYVGDGTGGVMRAIVNGAVVETVTCAAAVTYLYGGCDFGIYSDTPANFLGKNSVQFLNLTGPNDSFWWEPGYPSAWIDTYQVKWAWMIDAYSGLPDGTYDADSILEWYPGSFYALPNPPLPCDPGEPLPGTNFTPAPLLNTLMFLETYSGVGKIQGKLPDISPEGLYWVEHWNYDVDSPAAMNATGLYKLEYWDAEFQETWIDDTVGSPNYDSAKLSNIRSFEIGWYDYPITGTSYRRLELHFQNYLGNAYIRLIINGEVDSPNTTIELLGADNDGTTFNGMYSVPSYAFHWDTLNTARVEIEYTQQRVYFNGSLVLTSVNALSAPIDIRQFYVEQYYVSIDYLWISQLTHESSFINTNVPPPEWYLMTRFYPYIPPTTVDRSGSLNVVTSNTNNATVNTVDQVIYLNAGETLRFTGFTDGNLRARVFNPSGAERNNQALAQSYSYADYEVGVSGNHTIKVGGDANTSVNGTVYWDVIAHPTVQLDGLMPQAGSLPWRSDPGSLAVVADWNGGNDTYFSNGVTPGPNSSYQFGFPRRIGAQAPGTSIQNKTGRFYASYGDPLLVTPIPPVLDTRELLFQAQLIYPVTDVHGDAYTINIGFSKVNGTAITVTMHFQVTANGDGIAVIGDPAIRYPDQMQVIIKEGLTELANETVSFIQNNVYDFPFSGDAVVLEIREKTQRIYPFYVDGSAGAHGDTPGVLALAVNLADNPHWGNFAHVEFISDNPEFMQDGITYAIEGGIDWVWIKRVEPISAPTVSAKQMLNYSIATLPPDPIGTLVDSGSFAYSVVPPADRDTHTFYLQQGQVLRAGTSVPGGSVSSGSIGSYRIYYDYPNGPMIGDYSLGTEIERQALTAGNYTLEMTSFGGSTGNIGWEIYSNLRS